MKKRNIMQKISDAAGGISSALLIRVIVGAVVSSVVMLVSGAAGCEMLQSALLAITISLISGMFIDIVRDTWVTGSHTGEKDLAADMCGAVSAVGAMCCAGILF